MTMPPLPPSRCLPLACLLALSLTGPAPCLAQTDGRLIPFGESHSFRSAILDEDRELLIVLPEAYGRTTIAYPVLYVLDGSSHLLHASATVRFLAAARNRIPEMIVVAIPNTNRNRDMTPGPGAATFQRVLAEELIPWVERQYRAGSERILSGHSLSASFAVHTMLNHPELFDGYVAASAPLWRYDSLAADTKAGLPRAAKAGVAVYLSVGEQENARLRDGVNRFAAALKAVGRSAPTWTYVDMKDEDHNSTPQRSLYTALETRYREWRFPFVENPAELEAAGGLSGMQSHYARFATRFGFPFPPPEARLLQVAGIYTAANRHQEVIQLASTYAAQYPVAAERMVNQLGYDQLRRGRTDLAIATFRKNADSFPHSPNAFDSLGDAYCRAGNSTAGQESYRQAARVAGAHNPPHQRLAWYREKADKGC